VFHNSSTSISRPRLTDCQAAIQFLLFSYFLQQKRGSIHEDYYSAAVDNGEELFTFTLTGIVIGC